MRLFSVHIQKQAKNKKEESEKKKKVNKKV